MMDFQNSLLSKSKEARDQLIRNEIENESWDPYVIEHFQHGGWPDDVRAEDIKIDDSHDDSIVVDVFIEFIESVSSSCKDINHEHKGWAKYRITIDKQSGLHEVEDVDASIADYGGNVDAPFYPGDYN